MLNAAKNITAGILVGYGFTAFAYFGIMTQLWVDADYHRIALTERVDLGPYIST